MVPQRISPFILAAVVLITAQYDVSSFSTNQSITLSSRRYTQSITSTAIQAAPSASEKAAELRKKAEDAKRKAEELKKVAEEKAEKAMMAVNKAKERNAAAAAASSAVASEPLKPTPPTPKPAKTKASSSIFPDASEGAIIAINQETVEFTSGVLGAALALAFGASPVLAVVAAAAANYISKKEDLGELNEFVNGLSTASLNTFNWFGKLDSKYTILGKLTDTLDKSIEQLKNSEGESAETIKKIEETVSKTTKQIQQLADELDVVEGGKQVLGAVGDVLEAGIDKAVDANEEYKLTDRAAEAAKKAVDKVKK